MKRLILLFFILAPMWANAQTMCVRDKSLVISLDKNTGGTGSGNNASELIWLTDFPYGRIYGEATCLSATEGLGRTGTMGAYYGVEEYATTHITAEVGLNGKDANGDERKYCWCRATHPVSSRWVFSNAYASASYCVSNCARRCGGDVQTNSTMRGGVFGSVGL